MNDDPSGSAPPQPQPQPQQDLDLNGIPVVPANNNKTNNSGAKRPKRSKHRLVIDDIVPTDDSPNGDNNCIFFSPNKLLELDFFTGENLLIKGKRRHTTVLVAVEDDTLADDVVRINKVARRNLRAKLGDIISVHRLEDIEDLKAVHILPFDDTIEELPSTVNLFDDYLRPYFQNMFRPVTKGDTFTYGTTDHPEVEFKVMEIDPAEKPYGTIAPETVIHCEGDPVLRLDEDKQDSVGYDDLGGVRKQLALIREMIELPLRHPKLFRTIGIKPPKGVLLHGPPGTGKTMIAKAVANETGAFFFIINGPEIMSKNAGDSEANLKRAFEESAKNAPAILFIDEIDSIAPDRSKTQGELERRIVAMLLTLMDGVDARGQVVVVGATNRPNTIDPALRRFGRFDREIEIGVPDEAGRLEILQIQTKRMKLAADVDLPMLAQNTHGFVGADLGQLCTEAAYTHIREHMEEIDIEEEQIDPEVLASLAVSQTNFLAALKVTNPSTLRSTHVEVPNIKWSDIGGLEDVKRQLVEKIQWPLEHPDVYLKYGAKVSRGVLFFGPPGCGKTLLAKAVATESTANFISIKGPELLSKWFGESEGAVRGVFDKARSAAPCILFFDELDSIAKARGSSVGDAGGAGDRVINQLLTEMDGVQEQKMVFFIGATNRPDIIDPAITRPGRLDGLIYIGLPDFEARLGIFKASLKKAPVFDIDFDYLSDRTEGFSGADISGVCSAAVQMAIRRAVERAAKRKIEMEHQKREALKAGNLDWVEPPDTESDIPQVTRHYFDIALKNAKPSVSKQDIEKYIRFKRDFERNLGQEDGTPIIGLDAENRSANPTGMAGAATGHVLGDDDNDGDGDNHSAPRNFGANNDDFGGEDQHSGTAPVQKHQPHDDGDDDFYS